MTKQQNALTWRSALMAGTAAAFATGAAMPAAAADNARVITSAKDQVKVRVTGQVNRAVVYYDDDFNEGIKHIDNDFSSTRFRWHADAKVNNDIKIGAIMEVQAENNSGLQAAGTPLQDNDAGSDSNTSVSDRKLEFWVHHNQFGRVYVGKGDPGSNNSSLSTAHAGGVANLTALPGLGVGGLHFKNNGNSCAQTNTCVRLQSAISDFDGITRSNRIRYDTPVFAGFQARASHVDGGRWDASLWYNGKMFDTKIKGAVAYANGGASASTVQGQINGSLSMQHSSGIGLSFAGGYRNQDGRDNESNTHDPVMLTFGANFDRKYSEMGVTSISGQYQHVSSLAASGDVAEVFAIGVVQHIDAAAFELYGQYMHAELDRDGTTFGDLDSVMIGGRIKF